MKTNYDNILYLVNLIEEDLSLNHNLESLSNQVGYSKYHLHKMFTNIVGMSMHQYIKNRRLSEAAKQLLCTDSSILDIALDAGYESQQSFTDAFKAVFDKSPKAFRNKMLMLSLTPRFVSREYTHEMIGERIMKVRLEYGYEMMLAGFCSSTLKGFFVIPRLWKKLHRAKDKINSRTTHDWVYGFNDYGNAKQLKDGRLSFNYMACVEISEKNNADTTMMIKTLPKSRYAIFAFRAKPQDSVESVMGYIYKEWFPSSTYQLNEQAKYDFVKYGESLDAQGIADIEVWVPIL